MSSRFDVRETYLHLKHSRIWVKHGFLYVKARPSERLSEARLAKLEFPIQFKYNHSEDFIEESTLFGDPDEKYWTFHRFILYDGDLNTRSLK